MPVLSGKLPLLLHSAREFAMPIRHCIVHLIEKKPDGTPAVLHARDSELGESQAMENLLADLNESYNAKQGKAWGFFHGESGAYPFSGWLAQYMEGSLDFTAFSRQAVEHLQKLMEESNLSTGGHVLFAHYQQGMTDYLAIALLHHSEGVTVTESLDVAPAKHLDLGQLHLAARINISEWQNNKQSKQYISFIKGKNGKKVSEYFRDFIGCQEGVDAPGETRTLLKAFSDYVESEDLPEEQAREKTSALVDYASTQAKLGEPITLEELSGAGQAHPQPVPPLHRPRRGVVDQLRIAPAGLEDRIRRGPRHADHSPAAHPAQGSAQAPQGLNPPCACRTACSMTACATPAPRWGMIRRGTTGWASRRHRHSWPG